ncbi:MAG: hypothetical protein V1684_03210 [bacterium]
MKNFSKKIIFLVILSVGLFFSLAVVAADLNYGPQTPFPGFQGTVNDKMPITNASFGQYVGALYKYGVVLGASLAVIVMMIGGIIWLTSAGSADKIGQARSYIGGALGGLVLLLCSYLILYTINPDLVKLQSLNIKKVDEIKIIAPDIKICCLQSTGVYAYEMIRSGEKCDYHDLPPVEDDRCKSVGGDDYEKNKKICDNLVGSEYGFWPFKGTSKGFPVTGNAQCQEDCKAAGGANYDKGCFYEGYPISKVGGESTFQYCCLCIDTAKMPDCPAFK